MATTRAPVAGTGVKPSLLRTVKRSDNVKLQVTYAGHPLYRFAGSPADRRPDVYGQDVGPGLWSVLSPTGKPVETPRTLAARAAGAVVKARFDKRLKTKILVTASGMTLYEFVSDTPNVQPYPYCVDDATYHCVKHWLPLLTTDAPVAGTGVKQSLLGTVDRSDGGGTQVTYKGRPLYTWQGGYGEPRDRKPGDVFGQAFSGLWYVMSPTGKVITKP